MSGIRKFLLIIILIIFQTSALTIGGMTAKALFNGLKPVYSEVKNSGKDTGTDDTEQVRTDDSLKSSDDNRKKDEQEDKLTIDLETVVNEDQVEIHKVTKKDDIQLENETTSKIKILDGQIQTGTGIK